MSQPRGQRCAVVGGIVAERMCQLGARVIVVDGRVRDVAQMGEREDLMVRVSVYLSAQVCVWLTGEREVGFLEGREHGWRRRGEQDRRGRRRH